MSAPQVPDAYDLWVDYPDVPGAFWPCESGGDSSRAWCERVDDPDEGEPYFDSDDDAAWAVAQATGWPLRYAPLYGDPTRPATCYVQPFEHDEF